MTKTTTRVLLAVAASCATVLAACGGDTTTDGGPDGAMADGAVDGGRDAGRDLGADMDVDGGADLGPADLGVDMGDVDAALDMDVDAGDAAVDMDVDAGLDAGDVDMGVDAGDVDAGLDMGFDMGVDGGPPPAAAYVRGANLVANGGNVSFCLADDTGTPLLPPFDASVMAYTSGVPYSGTSDYVAFDPTYIALDLQIQAYLPTDLPGTCDGADPGLSLGFIAVPTGTLVLGHGYTFAWVGMDAAGGLPSVCGASFTGACAAGLASHFVLVEDDVTPSSGSAKLHVMHAIPNAGNLDFCWDPDGAGAMPAQNVAMNLPFGTASTYATLSAVTGGVFRIYAASAGATCAAHPGSPLHSETIPVGAPVGTAAFPFTRSTLAADSSYTVFLDGWLPDPTSAQPVIVVPTIDAHP